MNRWQAHKAPPLAILPNGRPVWAEDVTWRDVGATVVYVLFLLGTIAGVTFLFAVAS